MRRVVVSLDFEGPLGDGIIIGSEFWEDHGYNYFEGGYVSERGNPLVLRLPIAGKEGSARTANQ